METCLITALPVADGHPTAQPDLVREPQGKPTDVAGRNGYPASQPGSRADAQGDRTGPQRAKYKAKAEIGESSQRSPEVLKEILEELDKAARVAVLSSPGEAHHARRYEFSPKNAGVDDKRNTNAMDPQDFRYYCIEGAVAVLGSVLFGMILCCVICLWRKRQRRLSAASRAQPDTSSCSSGLDSPSSRPSTPESWTQQQEPSPVPGKPARLPQSTREWASASPDSRPARPPPPRPPWLSNSASRVLRDQPSDLEPPEELKPPARGPSPSRRPSCKGLSQPRQGMGLGYDDRLLTGQLQGSTIHVRIMAQQ
ncbi:uncharacterized protein LOC115337827 isoform X2 [Aquila chrysaetos chrysaetos]|uniref:uncharacterized protein LOC115337827 isoform X2 n=1 Tax=Aquila chrysaetos chrysaetos TaxID=223781 RepID=UPI001176F5A0|nr:uncharacterized protein LOC115337827 isoform X2 [Aquila chrysaetos chrysaetos]